MSNVSVYDARAGLSRLIDRALAGEEVVITRKGEPVVRLVPIAKGGDEQEPPRKRRLGVLAGEFDIPDGVLLEPLPDEILAAFYGEGEDGDDPLLEPAPEPNR